MNAPATPPRIFAPHRRRLARQRMIARQQRPDAARYLVDDMVEDVLDRLSFLRQPVGRALVIGDHTGTLAAALQAQGAQVTQADVVAHGAAQALDEEVPYPIGGFDLVASIGTLDTVNDLPGALIHMRGALASGGLALASLMAAGSLPALRSIMLAADGDRPAARLHPMIDVRSGGQLLQRAGWASPVIDGRGLDVRFRSLGGLVGDLRDQGLSAVLDSTAPIIGKAGWARAQEAFAAAADEDGRVTEHFEIVTLSGWRA